MKVIMVSYFEDVRISRIKYTNYSVQKNIRRSQQYKFEQTKYKSTLFICQSIRQIVAGNVHVYPADCVWHHVTLQFWIWKVKIQYNLCCIRFRT